MLDSADRLSADDRLDSADRLGSTDSIIVLASDSRITSELPVLVEVLGT